MNIFKRKKTGLEKEIELLLDVMREMEPASDGYTNMVKSLDILCKAKEAEKRKGVSADTVLIVLGNLVGIGFVLGYEKLGVISSKAFGMITKGRV